jgi:nucleotidyltransferase substrate binding protein (TIGR01987 family)
MPDISWLKRFSNFRKALSELTDAVEQYDDDSPDIIKEGVLQRFEFTHELAWKVMKDYLIHEGYENVTGSRTASKQAFAVGLIEEDGQVWMDMIESRNRTVHTYDKTILHEEFGKVTKCYAPALVQFEKRMLVLPQSMDLPKNPSQD